MKNLLLFYSLTLFSTNILSQKYDFKWIMGYSSADNPLDTGWGCAIMDFNTEDGNPVFYEEKYKRIDFNTNTINICDEKGDYLFSFNGAYIDGPNDSLMENADQLTDEPFEKYPEFGTASFQGTLILPSPGNDNQYLVFNKVPHYFDNFGLSHRYLEYSIVDMTKNNGKGKMIKRRVRILQDTLDDTGLSAIKHANGRDWWLICCKDTRLEYFVFLVSPSGAQLKHRFDFPKIKSRGEAGQNVFSSDGKLFASARVDRPKAFYYLNWFNFDRCSGILSDYVNIKLPFQPQQWYAGAMFSKNDAYFYYACVDTLYQFEVFNGLPQNRKVVDYYDGYREVIGPNFTASTEFGPLSYAPDGKAYMNEILGFRSMHTLHEPDLPTPLCNFKQHDIYCPTMKISIPVFPNFRLGPIDGSSCDTLGIDNVPWCHWRYNQDTANHLQFYFKDLSAYNVENWYWNFGDPASTSNTSTELNPSHKFTANGIYTVCLIVSNQNGADTLCRNIQIGTVNLQNTEKINISAWPNPCKDFLVVNLIDYNPQNLTLELYDLNGCLILSQKGFQGSNFIKLPSISSAIYLLVIKEFGMTLKSFRIIKQ
ncbi:MAG: T9SS type A sorting domain-containing protein [Saprospiraceae bacterium]|nr:T9SS type A sorting domain-containing protein [Saprospiraceae bacterium]MBK7738756.1 T9SS type A sorting domain-containing protein [Saprospiraceae bacterium]MBK7912672.1 T9SS type A sorting domain-containing protein [Saprospiraceae bacterium]